MATDSTPLYTQAGGLILRIAVPIFKAAIDQNRFQPGETMFEAWAALRFTATLMLVDRTVQLNTVNRERFVGALRFAHDFQHGAEPGTAPSPEGCHCETADLIRELAIVIEEAKEVAA
jgi:hypothetical protein